MTLWIGRRIQIGIGKESSRGVGVAPTYWLNDTSISFADKPTRALSQASYGGIWGGDQAPLTMLHAEGDIETELGDQSFGLLLLATLGSVSSGSVVDESYTHTFTLANTNQHQSLSICAIDPIGQLIFELAMINTLELNIVPDSIVTVAVNFMSKGSATASGHTASYNDEKKFVGRNLHFKIADDTSGLAAATDISLKSLTLTFEKNAEPNATLSTIQPEDIPNRKFDIKGSVELNYEDRTYLDYVRTAADKAVRIQLLHTDTIGSGTTPYSFTLDLSKVAFEEWEPDFSLDEVTKQTMNFTALYDAGGNDNVINSCTLVNGIVSY